METYTHLYFADKPPVPMLRVYALAAIIFKALSTADQMSAAKKAELQKEIQRVVTLSEAEFVEWCAVMELTTEVLGNEQVMMEVINDLSPVKFRRGSTTAEWLYNKACFLGILHEGQEEESIYRAEVDCLISFAGVYATQDYREECGDPKSRKRADWDKYFLYCPTDEFAVIVQYAIDHLRGHNAVLWTPAMRRVYGEAIGQNQRPTSWEDHSSWVEDIADRDDKDRPWRS